MFLQLEPNLENSLPEGTPHFDWFLQAQGKIHRNVKNRLTYEAELDGHHIFVKRHLGCGWGEVLKEWYRFRKPVVSARTEWEGAETLSAAGLRVPKVLGKGERGVYPHKVESFVVLEALEDCESLEHFREGWLGVKGPRWVALKRGLIREVAQMCRTMHAAGINHRDLYINHFLISRNAVQEWQVGDPIPLHLIDLHRVQKRDQVPERWLIKDLSSLVFSALDVGLTSTDCLRFLRAYLGPDWKDSLKRDAKIWQKILLRAQKLYAGFHGKAPEMPALLKNLSE